MKKKYLSTSCNLLQFSWLKLSSNKIALLLLFNLCMQINYAQAPVQNHQQAHGIMHIDPFIASLRLANGDMTTMASRIEYLIREVQPSIYVSSDIVKKYGENPICLFTDSKSLRPNIFSNLPQDDIEILIIKINDSVDLNSQIDLSLFANYPKLKYIYILSAVETTENNLLQLVRNNNPNYKVFYNILKAS